LCLCSCPDAVSDRAEDENFSTWFTITAGVLHEYTENS
jgi:hypothetical protein